MCQNRFEQFKQGSWTISGCNRRHWSFCRSVQHSGTLVSRNAWPRVQFSPLDACLGRLRSLRNAQGHFAWPQLDESGKRIVGSNPVWSYNNVFFNLDSAKPIDLVHFSSGSSNNHYICSAKRSIVFQSFRDLKKVEKHCFNGRKWCHSHARIDFCTQSDLTTRCLTGDN